MNVKEKNRNAEYEIVTDVPVPFAYGTARQRSIIITVKLPPEFPSRPPQLYMQNEKHRFIDPTTFEVMPAIHPRLKAWTMHTDLGKLLWEICRTTFQTEPPVPAVVNSPVVPGGNPIRQSQLHAPSAATSSASFTPPATYPEVESKSIAEIKELLESEEKFDAFFESLNTVKNMKVLGNDLKQRNAETTERNIKLQSEIDELRSKLFELNSQLDRKRDEFNQLYLRRQLISKQNAPETLAAKLNELLPATEQLSDELADRFLSGGMDCKEFVESYLQQRRIYHTRSLKRDFLLGTTPGVSSVPK